VIEQSTARQYEINAAGYEGTRRQAAPLPDGGGTGSVFERCVGNNDGGVREGCVVVRGRAKAKTRNMQQLYVCSEWPGTADQRLSSVREYVKKGEGGKTTGNCGGAMRILHILDLHVLSGVWQFFCRFGGLLAAQPLRGSPVQRAMEVPGRLEKALTATSNPGQTLET
jgi:hypothetical protein